MLALVVEGFEAFTVVVNIWAPEFRISMNWLSLGSLQIGFLKRPWRLRHIISQSIIQDHTRRKCCHHSYMKRRKRAVWRHFQSFNMTKATRALEFSGFAACRKRWAGWTWLGGNQRTLGARSSACAPSPSEPVLSGGAVLSAGDDIFGLGSAPASDLIWLPTILAPKVPEPWVSRWPNAAICSAAHPRLRWNENAWCYEPCETKMVKKGLFQKQTILTSDMYWPILGKTVEFKKCIFWNWPPLGLGLPFEGSSLWTTSTGAIPAVWRCCRWPHPARHWTQLGWDDGIYTWIGQVRSA